MMAESEYAEAEVKRIEGAFILALLVLISLLPWLVNCRVSSIDATKSNHTVGSISNNPFAVPTSVAEENQWRCACEGGFLPPGMLKSLGGAEAAIRMGTGQCYHKQK